MSTMPFPPGQDPRYGGVPGVMGGPPLNLDPQLLAILAALQQQQQQGQQGQQSVQPGVQRRQAGYNVAVDPFALIRQTDKSGMQAALGAGALLSAFLEARNTLPQDSPFNQAIDSIFGSIGSAIGMPGLRNIGQPGMAGGGYDEFGAGIPSGPAGTLTQPTPPSPWSPAPRTPYGVSRGV